MNAMNLILAYCLPLFHLAAFLVIPSFLSFGGFFVHLFWSHPLISILNNAGAAPWVAVALRAAIAPQVVSQVAVPQLEVASMVDAVQSSIVFFGWWGLLLVQLLFLGQGWATHVTASPWIWASCMLLLFLRWDGLVLWLLLLGQRHVACWADAPNTGAGS